MSNGFDNEVLMALGRLEGKVDALISGQHAQAEEISSLEGRVRTLELSRGMVWGGAIVAGALSSVIFNLVGGLP
jgi:hypothetical protein